MIQTVPDISPLMPMHQDPLLVIWNICKQRVWPHVSVTLSLKGRLGADYAGVPWPRHMLSQPWLITEKTLSAEGSLRPESPKTTLQADNSTRLTACKEGLAPGPWKFTLTTPYPDQTHQNKKQQIRSVSKLCIVPAPTIVKLPHTSSHSSNKRQGHMSKTKTHRFEIFVAFRFINR